MNADDKQDAGMGECSETHRNWPEFQRELTSLINRHSLERPSNLPDWVLAEYLTQCLVALNVATLQTRPPESNVVSLGR